MTHISESRHFPAGWLIIRQLNKTKKAAVQEVHLFGRQQNTTKSVLSLNHRTYFQEEIKKKKKIVDIEACEKGTQATPFNISCGPALQGFSGQPIYLNYAPILEFGTDFKEPTRCASFFPNHLFHVFDASQFYDHNSGDSIKSLNAPVHSLKDTLRTVSVKLKKNLN